jgi:hypothetical protein
MVDLIIYAIPAFVLLLVVEGSGFCIAMFAQERRG